MKILWISQDTAGKCWNQNYTYEERAWAAAHQVWFWGDGRSGSALLGMPFDSGRPIREVEAAVGGVDLIVLGEWYLVGPFGEMTGVRAPVAALNTDNYAQVMLPRAQSWKSWGVSVILHRYHQDLQNVRDQMPGARFIHNPWAVDPDVFHPREKVLDVALAGAVYPHIYPARAQAHQILSHQREFSYVHRPHPSCFRPGRRGTRQAGSVIGEDYAAEFARARIAVADGGTVRYPVAKYVEIPACGTCLLADWWEDLGRMGHSPDYTMVQIDPPNVLLQIRELLRSGQWQALAAAGRDLILRRHTWATRVAEVTRDLAAVV